MCLSPSVPHLINTRSLRCPCKAAWLAQSRGQWAVPEELAKGAGRGVTRLWGALLPCGVADWRWPRLRGTQPLFQLHSLRWPHPLCPWALCFHCQPRSCPLWTQAWDAFLILPDPMFLGLGKLCPRVPEACGLPLLPSPCFLPRPRAQICRLAGLCPGQSRGREYLGPLPALSLRSGAPLGKLQPFPWLHCSVRNAHSS